MKVLFAVLFLGVGFIAGKLVSAPELKEVTEQAKDNETIMLNLIAQSLFAMEDPMLADVAKENLNKHLILTMLRVTESSEPSVFASESFETVKAYIESSPSKHCESLELEEIFSCEKNLAQGKLRQVYDRLQ